jgi:hypothetical protein
MHGGRPLPGNLRPQLEQHFGTDLSTVRIHEGLAASALGVLAFTLGEHIHFAPGGFQPHTPAGLTVLGHELAHVLQQRGGRIPAEQRGWIVNNEDLEGEADEAGYRLRHGLPVHMARCRGASTPAIQGIKLSINGIQPNALLYTIDQAVESVRKDYMGSGRVVPPAQDEGVRDVWGMYHARDWLYMLGKLAITGQNATTHCVPCTLWVGGPEEVQRVHVRSSKNTGNVWSERVFFGGGNRPGKTDLNYQVISTDFARLFPGVPDADIARDILLCMMAQPKQGAYRDWAAQFIADMVTLMFGVEASRFPSSLATSLMLLDLIYHKQGYGRTGEKKFTLARAFHSTDWDTQESWYGGKFPYAVHETGSGNMRMRKNMAALNYKEVPDAVDRIRQLTQRHAVPRREVTLFVHWLEAHLSNAQISALTRERAQQKLKDRLELSYRHRKLPDPFPYSPRPETGEHSYKPKITIKDSTVMFWYEGGRYYHLDLKCKTLPGRYFDSDMYLQEFEAPEAAKKAEQRFGYENLWDWQKTAIDKEKAAKGLVESVGKRQTGTSAQARKSDKKACPVCIPK